jgi:hypothetical protein
LENKCVDLQSQGVKKQFGSFDKDLIKRKVCDAYVRKEFPVVQKHKAKLEFRGSVLSVERTEFSSVSI